MKLKDGKELTVRSTDVSMANPVGATAPDNTMLIHLSEATLLDNVKLRYFNKEIYTLTGSILLAMNPFEPAVVSKTEPEPLLAPRARRAKRAHGTDRAPPRRAIPRRPRG